MTILLLIPFSKQHPLYYCIEKTDQTTRLVNSDFVSLLMFRIR